MGIDTAPRNRRRGSLGASSVLNAIAVVLSAASLATFGLVGASVLPSAWLVIALGEGLLALAFVSAAGPGTQSIPAYRRRTGDEEVETIRPQKIRLIDERPSDANRVIKV